MPFQILITLIFLMLTCLLLLVFLILDIIKQNVMGTCHFDFDNKLYKKQPTELNNQFPLFAVKFLTPLFILKLLI